MAGLFCQHDKLHCDACDHHVDFFGIAGETVPKLGVQSLVPKERRDKDIKVINGEKHYFNWGLGKYFKSVKETEAYAASKDMHVGASEL